MGINAHDSACGATALARLRQKGFIQWRPRKLVWALVPEHAQGLLDVVSGRAFLHLRNA
jgi:hypothetical protein